MKNLADSIKQKAEQAGITEKAKVAAQIAKEKAQNAKEYMVESGKSLNESAKDGTLKEKA